MSVLKLFLLFQYGKPLITAKHSPPQKNVVSHTSEANVPFWELLRTKGSQRNPLRKSQRKLRRVVLSGVKSCPCNCFLVQTLPCMLLVPICTAPLSAWAHGASSLLNANSSWTLKSQVIRVGYWFMVWAILNENGGKWILDLVSRLD